MIKYPTAFFFASGFLRQTSQKETSFKTHEVLLFIDTIPAPLGIVQVLYVR